MPQRALKMNNDSLNLAISAGTGLAAWAVTLSVLVPLLWAVYVLILIAIKLPELYERNSIFRRGVDWIGGLVGWRRESKK